MRRRARSGSKGKRGRRILRWFDRTMLGVVMAIVAFILERAVQRSLKKADDRSSGRLSSAGG